MVNEVHIAMIAIGIIYAAMVVVSLFVMRRLLRHSTSPTQVGWLWWFMFLIALTLMVAAFEGGLEALL